jgi:hypothetical protein
VKCFVVAALFLTALPVGAQDSDMLPGKIHVLGRHYDLFLGARYENALSGATRTAFPWGGLAPAFSFESVTARSGLGFDSSYAYRRFGNYPRTAQLLMAAPGVRYTLLGTDATLVPWVSGHLGPSLERVDEEKWYLRATANVEVGVSIGNRFIVSGRYDQVARVNGYTLSSFEIRLLTRVY